MKRPDDASLNDPLARLEAEIAAAEAGGHPLPPQAYQMLEKLRELMGALKDLNASFEAGPRVDAAPPARRAPAERPDIDESGE
jgi:hypothetical protein